MLKKSFFVMNKGLSRRGRYRESVLAAMPGKAIHLKEERR
jgi:hypothetical protein